MTENISNNLKLEVKRLDFLRILSNAKSVVESRNAIPILSYIKISANSAGKLEVVATDMDISVSDSTDCTTIEAGAITMPALTLYDIVRKSPENFNITIDNTQNNPLCLITIGPSEFNLPTLPVQEFPTFQTNDPLSQFSIHSEVLKMLLSNTRHAISPDESRYYLNGIYLHMVSAPDEVPLLRAVATDGHRLARAQAPLPEGCEDIPGIIIPKKTVGEIVKLLDIYSGEVSIALSDKKITVDIGTTNLTSKLIDGKFPDYERVIPKKNNKQLELPRASLLRAIDLVTSISHDKTRAVKFNIETNKLVVSATSEMNGNAKGVQEIPATYVSPDKISIDFNSRYVLDVLNTIDGDNVKFMLSSNIGAAIAQDANEDNCIYVLMPMQV